MAQLLMVNPARRKRKRGTSRKRRRSPSSRKRLSSVTRTRVTRRYRRNPSRRKGLLKGVGEVAVNSLIGGAGAVATDAVTRMLPLPARFKSGWAAPITKGVVAIGLGWAVSALSPKMRKIGQNITEGSLAVSGYMVAKTAMSRFIPGLGAYDDSLLAYDDYYDPMGAYVNGHDMGAYVNGMGQSFDFQPDDFFEADTIGGMGSWTNAGSPVGAMYDNDIDDLL